MDPFSSEKNATHGSHQQIDLHRLRQLLNGNKTTSPAWLSKPDSQLPSLEQTTPRSLTLNSSVDTLYDDDCLDPPHERTMVESPCVDPVSEMTNLFSPSPKNATPVQRPSSVDPVSAIVNFFSPSPKNAVPVQRPSSSRKYSGQLSSLGYIKYAEEDVDHEEEDYSNNEPSSLDDSFDPFREIRNMLTPRAKADEQKPPEEEENDARTMTPTNAPLLKIANFFSPFKKKSNHDDYMKETPDRPSQAFFPSSYQPSPKRARHFEVSAVTTDTTVAADPEVRQLVTFGELLRDARSGMAKLAASAKECSATDWLKMIRDFDAKELAAETGQRTKRTIKMVVDSAKEVDPVRVISTAKDSARQSAETLRSNALVHPLPWFVIAAVSCFILVHVLFYNESVGTPAHRYWHFTMNVHESVSVRLSSLIVDRVCDAIQTQIGDESERLIQQVRSNMTCPLESGEEILLRISEALKNLEPKPDVLDFVQQCLAEFQQNPRILLFTISDAWTTGRQYLAMTEALDATVL